MVARAGYAVRTAVTIPADRIVSRLQQRLRRNWNRTVMRLAPLGEIDAEKVSPHCFMRSVWRSASKQGGDRRREAFPGTNGWTAGRHHAIGAWAHEVEAIALHRLSFRVHWDFFGNCTRPRHRCGSATICAASERCPGIQVAFFFFHEISGELSL
jgi:hypothetical protein